MYNDIITKIEEFDTIVIARHIGVDPDALCSQLALRDSIKLTFPEKKVLAIGTGSAKFTQLGRLDKIEKATGLNLRHFNDAVAFRLLTILNKLVKNKDRG